MSDKEAGAQNPDFKLQPKATPEAAPVAAEKKPPKAAVTAPGLEQYALTPRKEPDKNMVVQPGAVNEDFSIQPPDNLQLQKPQLGTTIDQYGQPMGPHAFIKDTGEDDVVDMSEYRLTREPNEGVVLIKNKDTLLAEVARKDAENLTILEIQNRIIQLQQLEEARAAAEQEKAWRKSAEVTRLTPDQMRGFKERQANGGGIQLPSDDEYQTLIRAAEQRRLKVAAAAEEIRNSLNPPELRLVTDPADTDRKESQSSAKLLKKGVSVSVNLDSVANADQLANTLQSYRTTGEPQQVQSYKANVLAHLNEDPAAVIRKYGLEDYVKPEDIRAEGRARGIDPQKAERLFDEMRIYHMTDDLFGEVQKKVEVEISKHSADSLSFYEGTRTAVHKYAESVKVADANAETVRILRSFKLQFDTALTEMRKQLAGELKKQSDPELFLRTKAAATLIAQENIRKILPNITPEQFLAVMSVQESYDTARNRLRGQIHEWYRKKYVKEEQIEQKKQSLESPMMINIKREDIVSPTELDALLAEYKRNPTPALEQELAEYTSHTDNREQAIKFYGLSGLIQPRDIRTDNVYEITEAVDNDRSIFFQNAIRLKHIVHDRLNQKVDSIVKAEFGTSPSTSIDAYTKLQAFIAEKNPDATADDKRLLQEYYMGFGEMVNQEIRKQSLIFKDQERVFIDIGKHKATKIPARVVLSTARKVAAERFVRANQAQLPEGMTPEQFLAGMSIADTYRFSEDKLKEEVFDWYRKNKPRQNKDYDEGKESMPRRRIPVPFLRRGQGPTPPETPPAPQPPIGPGNGPDNQPPGGNPPPENPPTPPGNGGAAGGVPSPDNPPPSQPGDGEEEDTVTFDVDQPPPGADENPDDQPSARYAEPAHPQGVTIDGQATVVNNTPNGNSVENAQPAPQMRRSLRNELTPRKLSEHAVKLYKKSKDRARRAVKLAYEGSPYELSEGLLRSAIKVQDIETTALIDYDQFSDRLNGFRGDEGADIRRRVENMNENDILDEWGLDGEFNERTVKDNEIRDQVLDAIYIREISRDVFHSNEDAFEEEVKKVSPESVAQFNRFESSVIDFLPEYLGQVADFQMRMLGRNMNLNPVTAAQYANSERFRIASKIFDENKNVMPADATPEQFLAALSVGESLLEMSDGIFNDLYVAYEYQENHVVPNTPAQTGSENSVPLIPAQKKTRRNIMDRVFPKRENPAVYLQSDNLLITAPKVKNVVTSRLIKINDVINTSLPKFRGEQRDRIIRMEIQNRDLNDIVTKWRLRTLFSESYIAGNNEKIRDSALLVDAIILREISEKYFEQLKPNFDAQLATVVPKQSLEQYQAHESEALKLYPEFQQVFFRQYNAMRRSHLTSEDDAETRRKDLIASRNIAAREIFDRNRNEMPEGSTPEKLLAALSVQETYSQIQDKIFQDLYHVYISSTPPDNDGSGTPPNEPPPPRPGGGPPRTTPPAPSSPRSSGMSQYDLQPGDNRDTTLVRETGPSRFHTVVDRNGLLQENPLKNLQDRIRNLANSNN